MLPLLETPGYNRDRTLRCRVYDADSSRTIENLDAISSILEAREGLVWLDIAQPGPDDLDLIKEEFGLHPVAIEEVLQWHARPKASFYEDNVVVIAHGMSLDHDGALTTHEVAIIAGDGYVVTLRAFPVFSFDEVERRHHTTRTIPRDATGLLYLILDTIVDGYFPITERYEDRLLRLESKLFDGEGYTERTEREIFQFRRALTLFRAEVMPMREVALRLSHTEVAPLTSELAVYFRGIQDNVIRAIEQIDITRELVNSTLDSHLAAQSQKQNEVTKQLTIIATIFLPLTYITGFFGQNFEWMTDRLKGFGIFAFYGIALEIVTLVIMYWFFKRKGWL